MKNVCIVVSNIDRVVALEWTADGLYKQCNFTFIIIGQKGSYLSKYLQDKGIETFEIAYKGKRDALKAVWKVFFYLRKRKIDVIHTHLVEATLYGLLPAWLLRIKRRIYTRHHSDYNYKYARKGIKYDLLSNWLATDIIAISGQVKQLLIEKENVPSEKITFIPHGIDIEYFEKPDVAKIQELSVKYNRGIKKPVIGIIARQTHWKGIQYTIPAFAELMKSYPDALLILANAHGDYAPQIDALLKQHLPSGSYVKIKYEYEIAELYRLFDVMVHVPIDEVVEAFGQVYIEALAAGVPCVFTLSGIAVDYIRNKKNAVVVPYCDTKAITGGMLQLLQIESLRLSIIANGSKLVHEEFSLEIFLSRLLALYEK